MSISKPERTEMDPQDGAAQGRPGVSGERRPSRLARGGAALLLVAAVALLLSACGAFIPPQSVDNPFGLDGAEVAVTFAGAAVTGQALTAQAVTGTASEPLAFPDFASPPINPRVVENEVAFASATLNSGTGPESITLSDITLQVSVWQGAGSYGEASVNNRAQFSLAASGPIELARGTCTSTECPYTIASGADLGTLSLAGAELGNFIRVSTTAPTPNQGQATLTVEAVQDDLAGATLTLTLEASEGTIRF